MRAHLDDADLAVAAAYEKRFRHDVMAHIKAYGLQAPGAAGIIHLGATSCYVTDNADLILYREGLRLIRSALVELLGTLARFARRHRAVVLPGYTHLQRAQPVLAAHYALAYVEKLERDRSRLADARRRLEQPWAPGGPAFILFYRADALIELCRSNDLSSAHVNFCRNDEHAALDVKRQSCKPRLAKEVGCRHALLDARIER